MNKLVRVPGIVISASVLSSRATKLHLQCRACRSTKLVYPSGGMGGVGGGSDRGLPRTCDAPEPEGQKKDCPLDPYLIIHSKSTFADQQTLKLQEAPDMVPVGELPRHMLLSADRYLTGKVVPGSRVIITGIYSTFQSSRNVSAVVFFSLIAIVDSRCLRNLLVLRHWDKRTSASSTLSCLRHPPVVQVVPIPLASNSHQRKRKSSGRWLEVKGSTRDLLRVLVQVSMVVSVRRRSQI